MSYITYKQADSRWGSKNYNGSSTMATAGCGPTSVAMLAYAVDGKTTPWDVAKYMQAHGYAIRNNGTAWAGIPAAMRNFGLKDVKNVPAMTDIWKLLAKGYCAVFLFRAGSRGGITWTTAGHYIAVTGYKVKNGKHYLYTRDSGGRNHTGWYCYEDQMKGLIPQVWCGYVPGKLKEETAETKMDGTRCIDVSDHQGKIDWDKVKKSGVESVIIRAGYGKNNADGRFLENIKGAIAQEMNIGTYWFSYAYTVNMAKNEAKYCLADLKPYMEHVNLGVWFDWEYDSMNYAKRMKTSPTKALITSMTKAFCEAIEAAGLRAGFYYNYDYKQNHYNMDELKGFLHWYALYSETNKDCDIQQTSSSGSVDGITGKVDMDIVRNTAIIGAKAVKSVANDEKTSDSGEKVSGLESFPSRGYWQTGDSGEAIKELQELLNKKNSGSKLKDLAVDGKFGSKTEAHVKLFQDARKLTIDGKAGPKTIAKLWKAVIPKRWMAVNWAVSIARDNTFMYGVGSRAHHNGCYFCGTNITGPKKAKKGTRWEKTYCCNPFIHAAYAHGAGIPSMLAACKKANGAGMKAADWTKHGFKSLGKCKSAKYADLKAGDVIICGTHVWMFTGSGWLVEAAGEGWTAGSIAHKKIAKSRYEAYQKKDSAYVLRYAGK